MGEPSSLNIQELQGERNNLELVGRALPYRPLTFEGSMRAEFTWYPGNPIATVQMLGPQEGTTSINGMWKDRFIKTTSHLGIPILGQTGKAYYNGSIIDNVSDLVKLADGFRRRGQLVEVTWDDIVRQGIISKFKQSWTRPEDVEWEMEFTWMSQGEDELPIVFNVLANIADAINGIVDAVNNLVEAINELKDEFAAIASWVNAVNNLIDGIVAAASGLVDLAKQAVKLAVAPFAIVGNMVAACQTIGDQCKELVKTFESLPGRIVRAVGVTGEAESTIVRSREADAIPTPTRVVALSGVGDPNAESQGEVLAAERVIRKAKRAARKLKAAVVQRQQELIAQSQDQTKPLATIIARDGMDLRDVSTQYYGTPGEWIRLMLYNGFNTSRLLAGDVVIVPQLGAVGQPAPASTLRAP
jgi:archaellum component FlaC/uncharacterized membrane protein